MVEVKLQISCSARFHLKRWCDHLAHCSKSQGQCFEGNNI